MAGSVAWQRLATDATSLFAFEDRRVSSSVTGSVNWSRQFSTRTILRARYQLTWSSSSLTPFFAGRTNVSGDAGIAGNDQSAGNWGPPTLSFPAIAGLTDGQAQRTASTTHAPGVELLLRHGPHNVTIGGDFRWIRHDTEAQPDPRGTLTFAGDASGNALADFLLGIPGASSIAYGDATHLRGVSPDAYANDDWRILPTLTLNVGVRWEYDSPFVESSGRLVNLDVGSGFSAIAPVAATDPVGSLTGTSYPASLIRPDRGGIEPRVGVAWRPSLASPLVFKASYGLYRNLGGYQSLALLLAQQSPFSKTFNIQNTADTPLTLAAPFPDSLPSTAEHVRDRPELPRGVRAYVGSVDAAGAAGFVDAARRVPRHARHAPHAGLSAEHAAARQQRLAGRSRRLYLRHVQRIVAPQRRAVHASPPAVRRPDGERSVHARESDR